MLKNKDKKIPECKCTRDIFLPPSIIHCRTGKAHSHGMPVQIELDGGKIRRGLHDLFLDGKFLHDRLFLAEAVLFELNFLSGTNLLRAAVVQPVSSTILVFLERRLKLTADGSFAILIFRHGPLNLLHFTDRHRDTLGFASSTTLVVLILKDFILKALLAVGLGLQAGFIIRYFFLTGLAARPSR